MSDAHDDPPDDPAAPPLDTPHWQLRGGRAKLLWMRAQREANRPVNRQEKVEDPDPDIEKAIREGRAVTGPYEPF
jgi:hypothetical protein